MYASHTAYATRAPLDVRGYCFLQMCLFMRYSRNDDVRWSYMRNTYHTGAPGFLRSKALDGKFLLTSRRRTAVVVPAYLYLPDERAFRPWCRAFQCCDICFLTGSARTHSRIPMRVITAELYTHAARRRIFLVSVQTA